MDVGHTGHVAKGQLAASQIDWAALQRDRDHWLRCVRRAFDEFDADHDGVCSLDEIVACLKAKLPLTEVRLLQPRCPVLVTDDILASSEGAARILEYDSP